MGLRHHVFGSLLEAWWNRSWALSKLASWTLGIPDRWTSDECRPYTCSQGTLHHWWDKLVFFSVTLLLTDHTRLTSRSTRKSWGCFVRNLPFSSFTNSTAESLLFWCSFRPSYVIFCRLSAENLEIQDAPFMTSWTSYCAMTNIRRRKPYWGVSSTPLFP